MVEKTMNTCANEDEIQNGMVMYEKNVFENMMRPKN